MGKGKKIAVVGVGNILLGDEGLGVRAVERLKEKPLPASIQVFDAGTSIHQLLPAFEGFDKMVIIDAVKAGQEPGAIYRFTLEELESDKGKDIGFMLSLHELDVPRAIALERLVSKLPEEIVFIGMEPEKISEGMELSGTVSKKMDQLLSAIEKEFG